MEEKDRLVGKWGLSPTEKHPRSDECYDELRDVLGRWSKRWLGIFDSRDLTFAIHDMADEPRLVELDHEPDQPHPYPEYGSY